MIRPVGSLRRPPAAARSWRMDEPARTTSDLGAPRMRLVTDAAVPGSTPSTDSYRRLADVFHDLLSEQSLDSLLVRIADTLDEIVPYEALHIYEADESKRHLVPALVRSDYADEILNDTFPFGVGITGWAVEHRQPVLSNQAHLDPRVAFVPGTPVDPEALICVPLIARGVLKGTLNVYRIGEHASFSDAEFELAQRLGDAAALALDNAHIRARLEREAQTDSLTGLYNHRYFHERLRRELTLASAEHTHVAVVMVDIDDFKKVNDVFGHAVGDDVLADLADHLRASVRAGRRRLPDRRRGVRRDRPGQPPGAHDRARDQAGRAPRPGRARPRRQDRGLDRDRAGPRARRQPARARRLRRGGDDDREGSRQEPGRLLRRGGHGAAGGQSHPRRGHPLDRAPEDAPVAGRQAQSLERRPRDRDGDRERAAAAHRLPQLPGLHPRGRGPAADRIPGRAHRARPDGGAGLPHARRRRV